MAAESSIEGPNRIERVFSWKILLARVHDIIMAGVAMIVALGARYEFSDAPPPDQIVLWVGTAMATAAVAFQLLGLGRGIWRFASITDLRVIVLAATTSLLAFLVVVFLINRLEDLPRSAPIIAWFVLIVLLGAPRLFYRAVKDGSWAHIRSVDLVPTSASNVIIVGNVSDSDKVIRAYGLETSKRYKVQGIVDYAGKRRGSNLRGIPVLGEFRISKG